MYVKLSFGIDVLKGFLFKKIPNHPLPKFKPFTVGHPPIERGTPSGFRKDK